MAFEGARACPKQIRWLPDSSGCLTKPPDRLHILRPGAGRRLGLVSQKPVSLTGCGGVCGVLLHANAQVCAKVSSLTLSVCCVRQRFPFVPMCCIFGRAAAREAIGLSQASLVSHVLLICMKRIEDKRLFFLQPAVLRLRKLSC